MRRRIQQSFWQGVVKLFVLHQATRGPVYGGKLFKSLRKLGHTISAGSLYPTLHALEQAGFLRSYVRLFKGRIRKYYEITPEGRLCLTEVTKALEGVVRILFLSDLPKVREKLEVEDETMSL